MYNIGIMKNIIETEVKKRNAPIKAVQFGEGNFLRAFADYMIDILNERTEWNGSIVIVKPIEHGSLEPFKMQDSVYTVLLRGLEDGVLKEEKRLITSCADAVSCYEEYEKYAALAKLDTLRFIISNTTEAGIVYVKTDKLSDCPPSSYPGKLTKFLYERYKYFGDAAGKGLIVLPVELIDDNGRELKKIVKKLSSDWNLGYGFEKWLDNECVFTSTLVDRIVTGFPHGEEKEVFNSLGYEDMLLVTGEPFALWVIESDNDIRAELPFDSAGLPVLFTNNQKPYKQRKVRILNGAHTSLVPVSFLCGNDCVGQSMDDADIENYVRTIISEEIIPTLDLDKEELFSFANAVTDRFKNPFIKHSLLAISLNGISKYRARCLPSLLEYYNRKGELPRRLIFSLAAMRAFYNGTQIREETLVCCRNGAEYEIRDDAAVLSFFSENPSMRDFLGNVEFWGLDLNTVPGLAALADEYLDEINKSGVKSALLKYFSHENN